MFLYSVVQHIEQWPVLYLDIAPNAVEKIALKVISD